MKIGRKTAGDWLGRRAVAWASYDVATSIYAGVIPALLAPFYIRKLSQGMENATAVWGIVSVIAVLVSSVAALATASATSRVARFSLLTILTAALAGAIAALAWNPGASLAHAAVTFVAAQSFYFAAMTIYESFLPDVAPEEARQKLSGFGWAMGYFGGILAIVMLLVMVRGQPESLDLLAQCFAALALLSGAASAIVLAVMRREGFAKLQSTGRTPQLSSLVGALRYWRANPAIFQLLIGTTLIQMGVFVVITFTTPILASRFGQGLEDLLWLLFLIHVLSVPSTLGWSHLMTGSSRRGGALILLSAWAVVLVMLAFGSGPWMPLLTVIVIGCCLGATFSGLRGFLAEAAEGTNPVVLFALGTVSGRIAAALGPGMFSVILLAAGEQVALVVMTLVLAVGGAVLFTYLGRTGTVAAKSPTLS